METLICFDLPVLQFQFPPTPWYLRMILLFKYQETLELSVQAVHDSMLFYSTDVDVNNFVAYDGQRELDKKHVGRIQDSILQGNEAKDNHPIMVSISAGTGLPRPITISCRNVPLQH